MTLANSFGVKVAQLWNLLPLEINPISTLGLLLKSSLAKFLKGFPDTTRTKQYTTTNNNSLLKWYLQKYPSGVIGYLKLLSWSDHSHNYS